MIIPAIVHLQGEDAIYGELDAVPDPTHNFLLLRNVRKKDGKPLPYLMEEAEVVLYAWHKITFIEVLQDITIAASTPSSGSTPSLVNSSTVQQTPAGTTVLGFFRDDT